VVFTGDEFAAFMGMWLAEGSRRWGSSRSGYSVTIAQRTTSKGFAEYQKFLDGLGRTVHYTTGQFIVYSRALHTYLQQFGGALQKFVPEEIKNMSRRQLAVFWHFYHLGDGSTDYMTINNQTYARQRIYTSSKRMADDLQEIAQKLGFSASIAVDDRRRDITMKDGRVIRGDRSNPSYVVTLRKAKSYGFAVEHEFYEGPIFCFTVPNETLYVRRNGLPIWSGNSSNWRRKAWVISNLANLIETERIVLHDRATYDELRNYVYMGARGYESWGPATDQGHDDLVMSLAICLLCESTEHKPEPMEIAEPPKPRLASPVMQGAVWAQEEGEEPESWTG
jgi:hypothetical protein